MNHDQSVRIINNIGLKETVQLRARASVDAMKVMFPNSSDTTIAYAEELIKNVHVEMQPAYDSMANEISGLFTDDEANDIITFLESNAGRKYIKSFPDIVDICDHCLEIQDRTLLKEREMKFTGEIN